MDNRLLREKKTIESMIKIYCSSKHNFRDTLCIECNSLLEYAEARLSRCIFGEMKPVCARCNVHCYRLEMKEKIKEVMRYSGRRMLVRHPVITMQHLIDALIYKDDTCIR